MSFQILSLCSSVLAICYDKYNKTQSQSTGKKKKHQQQNVGGDGKQLLNVLSAKDKVVILTGVMRELKSDLQLAESSLGKNNA